MGLFSKILEKLGLKKQEDEAKPAAAPAAKPAASSPAASTVRAGVGAMPDRAKALGEAVPKAVSQVDVVTKLETLAKGKGLNWKVSIVDLLKLLDLDSSKEARIELAKELGCPADLIGGDYSKMNVWLHKEVLRRIAANGGNIPKELLD